MVKIKFKVTIKPSENFNTGSITVNAISIYQAVLFAEDILTASGVSPCDVLMIERIIDKENV